MRSRSRGRSRRIRDGWVGWFTPGAKQQGQLLLNATATATCSANQSNSSLGGCSGSGQGSTGLSLSESLNTQERDTIPEAKIIGNTKIIADKRANTIIVLGNKEVKTKVFALLEQLDVRAPQVMLHTIIGELNLTNNRNLGVNYILNRGSSAEPHQRQQRPRALRRPAPPRAPWTARGPVPPARRAPEHLPAAIPS